MDAARSAAAVHDATTSTRTVGDVSPLMPSSAGVLNTARYSMSEESDWAKA